MSYDRDPGEPSGLAARQTPPKVRKPLQDGPFSLHPLPKNALEPYK
jgi:hypothetical protein